MINLLILLNYYSWGKKMIEKNRLIAIIIIIILLFSIFPNIASQSFKANSEETVLDQSLNIEKTNNSENITLKIIAINNKGNVEQVFKDKSSVELENMKSDFIKIINSDLDYIEKFEYVFEKLKENGLIPDNIELEDIIDFNQFENKPLKFDNTTNKNFAAHLAPIIVVGGGFGLGLGDVTRRVLNGFVHFIGVLGGLALVYCLDFIESMQYILFSFLAPIFLGYMSGYIGIVAFAVSPGLFFSNLFMIGFVPFTLWLCFPEAEDE